MSYEILTATFPSTVYTNPLASGTNINRPFFNQKNFTLGDATLSYTSIEDDDDKFHYMQTNVPNLETMQKPTTALDFGDGSPANGRAMTVGVDEPMVPYAGSYIVDSQGNRFIVMFPAKYIPSTTSFGTTLELGVRKVVFIFPVGVADGANGILWPVFNPNETFSYVSAYTATASSAVAYGPQRAPCFTPGTLIETEQGLQAVECLKVGDRILTRDHGFQPLRWIGSKHVTPHRLDLQPNLRPIRIAAGALGHGCPDRDLVVSPQHRILVGSAIAERMFGVPEVLVAAKHLLGLEGVTVGDAGQGVTYLHLLFDDHQTLRSNGAWTESLYVGPGALDALPAAARREIMTLFPQLSQGAVPAPSRRLLTGKEGRRLTLRHAKNRRALAPAL